jgi:hypothetical protein
MRTDEGILPCMLQLPTDHIRQIRVFKTLRIRALVLFADLLPFYFILPILLRK